MTIRVLSDQTINKIAAGEVIENPASVVKELAENAFDAGSKTITVEIEKGGFSLIRISDDGCGMSFDDLLLSLERHATSKIREAEDLIEVLSMGFRGEALASIAAISKLRILTAREEVGAELFSDGGKIKSAQKAARNRGTTVEVRNLFFNVPARKKFQKSQGRVQSEITKLLTKFALAHPHIRMKYFADEKMLLDVLPGKLRSRADTALGEVFLKGAVPIDFEENRCKISGYFGSPFDARSNRLGQFLFVNGRSVVCPQMNRAIYEGYGTRISSHLHPTFILHVTLPPDWIDVNVHPQKREVRLREELVIQNEIRSATLKAFQGGKKVQNFPKMEWNLDVPLKFQEEPPELPLTLDFEGAMEEIIVLALFDSYLIVYPSSLFQLPDEFLPYDGFLLIDLKSATARILYEKFLQKRSLSLQSLMVPITIEVNPFEEEILKEHLGEIQNVGIDLRFFGERCFIVDALSPEIRERDVKGLLQQYIEVFDQKLSEKEREKKLAFAISSYARSQKKEWTVLEGKLLVKELLKTSSPYDCPQGKKTVIHLSHDRLAQLFQKTAK